MVESCCLPRKEAPVFKLPVQKISITDSTENTCPVCGMKGKVVQGQTIKALLSVSLREVNDIGYLFCKTQTCPVVYFSSDGKQTFSFEQVREQVYQKDPENDKVFICYCFRHKVGDLRSSSPQEHVAIVEDINSGVSSGQCACDLRNPQGSCCLGNVRGLIKSLETKSTVST